MEESLQISTPRSSSSKKTPSPAITSELHELSNNKPRHSSKISHKTEPALHTDKIHDFFSNQQQPLLARGNRSQLRTPKSSSPHSKSSIWFKESE
jgi:hypothetical protein